ncbi:permease prefix domain 1-containing protein [Alicyclobacillus acidiphilus]|uniref:permease prefix domain 1-containing protein n=1 Tax=Alicyclobacillus acidiphilus TaxID=182455 RepID=UPI00082B9463|nr:permease prefix domain 1-containing protein [Alicyclobacillus acidiphilus]
MTSPIQSYLERVMRWSGLTKREKAEWIEEMSSHLNDEIQSLMKSGHDENDATKMALEKFGQPTVIRRKIAKETFGLSIPMIYGLSSLFLIWFFIDLFIVHSQFPGGWYKRYPDFSGYASSIVSAIPNSPSLMLALCVSVLMLFKTRCLKDRASILLTLSILGVIWVLMRLPQSFNVNELLFGFRDLTIREPWVSVITAVFIVWGLLLYLWTRNSWIGVIPTLISIVTGLWQPFMYGGFHWLTLLQLTLLIAVRCLPIVALIAIFRAINKWNYRRSVSTS